MEKRLTLPIIIILVLTTSGCLENVNQIDTTKTIQEFDMRISTSNSFKDDNFTLLVRVNGTEITNRPDMTIYFNVQPTPPVGATINDYVSIFFSVEDFDTQIFKFNGDYQIRWTIDNDTQFYVQGSKSMSYINQYNISLSFNFNIYELLRVGFSNAVIKFHDKSGLWSKQYGVTFIVIDEGV